MSPVEAQRSELAAALGDMVLVQPSDVARYETGYRHGQGRALAVVRPRSTADVVRTVRLCRQFGIALVPQGANTGLVGASVPDGGGRQAVVSLERLRDPLSIDADARTATVGAGVSLNALNEAAAAHGLFFPIDLGANPTIGGLVSTNAGGCRVLRYGDVRRNLLGLQAVLADGTVIDALAPLRKASLGFDVKQLFIGTGGAHGIITAATLALQPLPTATAAALVVPKDIASVTGLLRLLEARLGEGLSAFEGMSRGAMAAAIAHIADVGDPFAPDPLPDHAILVEAAGRGSAADAEHALLAAVEDALVAGLAVDARAGSPHRLWRLRHALSEGLRHEGRVLGLDIALPLGAAAGFRADLEHDILPRYSDFRCCDFGHWGDGGEHLNFVYPPAAEARADMLRAAVYKLVARHRGAFSAEHGIGPANVAHFEQLMPEGWRRLALGVKHIADPQGLLGRGWAAGPPRQAVP